VAKSKMLKRADLKLRFLKLQHEIGSFTVYLKRYIGNQKIANR